MWIAFVLQLTHIGLMLQKAPVSHTVPLWSYPCSVPVMIKSLQSMNEEAKWVVKILFFLLVLSAQTERKSKEICGKPHAPNSILIWIWMGSATTRVLSKLGQKPCGISLQNLKDLWGNKKIILVKRLKQLIFLLLAHCFEEQIFLSFSPETSKTS